MNLPRKLRPCTSCGKPMQTRKSKPMCHPCRRKLPSSRRRTCCDCESPMESRLKEGESRCWECSRDRRAAAPRCDSCGGDMGSSSYYRWLKGHPMPPLCWTCRKAGA